MSLRLELYRAEHVEQVKRFNARLRHGNVDAAFLLPEVASSERPEEPLGKQPTDPFIKRQFLALDDEHVRGGMLLQEQVCDVGGKLRWCANIQMPISEGIVDRKFSYVASRMVQLLLRARPFVFAVGIGSLKAQFAQFLSAMKWRVTLVQFQFFVFRPARFLRELRPFHSTIVRSIAAHIGAWSGVGTSAVLAVQKLRKRHADILNADRIYQWDDQSSLLWAQYRGRCSFAAVRDEETLPLFLDLKNPRLFAYRLTDEAAILRGWILLQITDMQNNQYFGALRLATVLDMVCAPTFERAVIRASLACARDQRADLMVMNQQHRAWTKAADENGFWKAPSNYVFATSPELTQLIGAVDPEFVQVHLSRSDGDGRLNL